MARIRTGDGRLVDPLNITAEDVRPKWIIRSLAQINRFTGHALYPFSVAQHSYNLAQVVPPHLKRAAIVHDFTESWFNDMASPLKREMPEYRAFEKLAGKVVMFVHCVTQHEMDEFDEYDKRIYKDERDVLFPIIGERGLGDDLKPLGINPYYIREMYWRDAEAYLASEYIKMFGKAMYDR
jgi:hypothetical protein